MGRFFFHIRDGASLICDEEGMELVGARAIAREARLSASEIAGQYMRANKSTARLMIEVANEAGTIVSSQSVRLALN
jgi:hypothetical protein